MGKSADGPASGRMGFGFRQCKAAGVPYLQPKSAAQFNLETFLKKHPELVAKAVRQLKRGKTSATILHGFRERGHEGHFAMEYWRDVGGEDWAEIRYSDDEAKLRGEATSSFKLGLYKRALLWKFKPRAGKWYEAEVLLSICA